MSRGKGIVTLYPRLHFWPLSLPHSAPATPASLLLPTARHILPQGLCTYSACCHQIFARFPPRHLSGLSLHVTSSERPPTSFNAPSFSLLHTTHHLLTVCLFTLSVPLGMRI